MIFVRNLYELCTAISVLAFMCTLAGAPTWAMEEDNRDESFSMIPASSLPRPYPPTLIRGIPSTYADNVEREEWDMVVSNLKRMAVNGISDLSNFPYVWQKYEESFYTFFSLYQGLHHNYKKTFKSLNVNKLLSPLFRGVTCFESLYGLNSVSNPLDDQKGCVNTFQKMCVPYMRAYQEITRKELGFFGSLDYVAEHDKAYKHLYYTRDSNGFRLFTIYPHELVKGTLYETYISYGENNHPLFMQRTILFHLNQDKTIKLEKSSGLIIHRTSDNALSIVPYMGCEGEVPFSTKKGLLFRGKWFDSNPLLALQEGYLDKSGSSEETISSFIKHNLPPELKATNESIVELVPFRRNQIKNMHEFVLKILNGEPRKFIVRPTTDAECREAEFVFLLDLQEKCQETPEDEDVRLLVDAVIENHEAESLEEVIAGYEENLTEAYIDEEAAKIRAEQEARQTMVRNQEYDKLKGKKAKNNKKRRNNKARNQTSRKEPEKMKEENIAEKAKAHAEARIKLLKKKEIRKHMKYNEYLEMINIAIQELRQQDISVSGALNGSSHGSLAIGDKSVPVYRPHGKHKTVHIKSARNMLDNLLNTYFSVVSSSEKENPKKIEK